MSDASSLARNLRDRLSPPGDERLGRALSDLIENPLVTGAIGRAFDAREKATQAQELAMAALNLPSAADIERLTRRLRSLSHRLEGIEDGVDRLDRSLATGSPEHAEITRRLEAIETELGRLGERLDRDEAPRRAAPAPSSVVSASLADTRRRSGTRSPKRSDAKPSGAVGD